ncbi:MAG: amino acid adenylation domain-containing protein, partial [Gammaproteobacteria bacterium]|nr:amino acid adenylation domain-containing protein [Gammaproteobacteria bacterium]
MSNAAHPLWDSIQHSIDLYGSHIAASNGLSDAITYTELGERTAALANTLRDNNIKPGDRVAVCLPKNVDMLVAILGILRLGAAYVPVNPLDPPARIASIIEACSACAILTNTTLAGQLFSETGTGQTIGAYTLLVTGHTVPDNSPRGLAYLLHTSGSSGQPKGVMVSEAAVVSFIDWCKDTFSPGMDDRLSAFAPFHFAMSVFDIYLALGSGCQLVLITDDVIRHPPSLAKLISDAKISIWYSTPSAVRLLLDHGLEKHRFPALRLALFAGEAFPPGDLRRLRTIWAEPGMYNLYGSTETNVIAWQEIPGTIPEDRVIPYPLGKACSHVRLRVMTREGLDAGVGEQGEIHVSGPPLMEGYAGSPGNERKSFIEDTDGTTWHRTGDIAEIQADGALFYVGREGRIVKRRGYRIALGEIEAVLFSHPDIKEAAVVSAPDERTGVRIAAFYMTPDGNPLSLIKLKQYCAGFIPATHIPDRFVMLEKLPRT